MSDEAGGFGGYTSESGALGGGGGGAGAGAGVTSISVNGGAAQHGAVSLTIPVGSTPGSKQILFGNVAGTAFTTDASLIYTLTTTTLTLSSTGVPGSPARLNLFATDTTGTCAINLNSQVVGGATLQMFANGPTVAGNFSGTAFPLAANAFVLGGVNTSGVCNTFVGSVQTGGSLYLVSQALVTASCSPNSNFLVGSSLNDAFAGSSFQVNAVKSVAAAAGALWDGVRIVGTLTLTGATTTTANANGMFVAQPTITGVSAQTITTAASFKLGGSPIKSAAGGVMPTVTNLWGAWFADNVTGDSPTRFDSKVRITGNAADAASVPDCALAVGLLMGMGTFTASRQLSLGAEAGQTAGIAIGQGPSNGGRMQWTYNATPGNATFTIDTYGQNNSISFGGKSVTIASANGNINNSAVGGSTTYSSTVTVASAGAATWDGFRTGGTLTLSGVTATNVIAANRFQVPTINGTVTIGLAATQMLDGAPTGTASYSTAIGAKGKYAGAVLDGGVLWQSTAVDFDVLRVYDAGAVATNVDSRIGFRFDGGGFGTADTNGYLLVVSNNTGLETPLPGQFEVRFSAGMAVYGTSARTGGTKVLETNAQNIGFFGHSPVAQQTIGANVNNVIASGTTGQFDDFTNGVVYATDYPALHATVSQLCRSMAQVTVSDRNLGLGA